MPPRPDDNYNPTATVSPSTSAPSDYNTTKASPDAFGAQVGGAISQTGQVLGKLGDEALQIGLQRQGMINETLSTDAETQASTAYGKIIGDFKAKEGLQAVNAVPQTVAAIQQVRQQIRSTLPNSAAQRSFDMLAARRESFALQDVNSYGAVQVKAADKASASASLNNAIESASDPTIASNDSQFHSALGDIQFQAARITTNLGYGADAGTGMQQDPKTGAVTFDTSTKEGQAAQAVHKEYVNKAVGQAWVNRINTLATDPQSGNINTAIDTLTRNKADIPPETYAKLSHQLAPAWRNEQARGGADQFVANINGGYNQVISGQGQPPQEQAAADTINKLFPGSTVTSQARTAEHNATYGSVSDSMHLSGNAIYFVPPKGTTLDQVRAGFQSQGINPTELLDEGDHIHVGWAPKNQPAPAGIAGPAANYRSLGDYYGTHMPEILENAKQEADKIFPGDATFSDQYVARVQQKLTNVMTQERAANTADTHLVMSAIQGDDKHPPITSEDQFVNGSVDPAVKAAWISMNANNGQGAQAIRNIITANSHGRAVGYGTDFYKHTMDVLSGAVQSPDQLGSYIVPGAGNQSPLTNTGQGVLAKQIQDQQTPEGHAFAQAQSTYLQGLHSKYIGSGQAPGISDTSTNEKFNSVLMDVIPKIQAGKAAGLTAQQMFDPKSKDYITPAIAAPDPVKLMTENAMRNININQGSASAIPDFKSLSDLQTYVGKNPRFRQQAINLALQNKWIQPTPPSVPKPEF